MTQDKNNGKGRAFGDFVSRDLPVWLYGAPGPELIIAPPRYTAHYVPEPISVNGDAHPGYYHMELCQQSPDAPDADSTLAYLALALEHLDATIRNLSAACRDSRVDESLGEFTLDALRGIRAEIAAEVEARRAEA